MTGRSRLISTNFGHNQMWRNNGDGTFTDVTAQSGTDVLGWSCSAAFVDYDRDGWLDLFVGGSIGFRFTGPEKVSRSERRTGLLRAFGV